MPTEFDINDSKAVLGRLRKQVEADALRLTSHAHQEMAEEGILLDEVCHVLLDARVLENYPEHRRGPCCLVCGRTARGRYLHVVTTTAQEVAIVITVYEPALPKWVTPFERRETS